MIRSCRKRAWAGAAVCFLVAALAAPVPVTPAVAESDPGRLEDAVIAGYAEGSYRLCYERLEKMLTGQPALPVSVLYYGFLFRLADLVGPAVVDETAGRIRDALLKSGDENAPSALLRLNCEIEKNRYRIDGVKAKQVTDELKPVRRWTLFGPYLRYGQGDIEHRFQPEIISDLTRVSPQKKTVVTNYDGWLDPGRYLNNARGVVYAAVSFYTESAVRIRVCSESVYRVFINGRAVVWNRAEDRRNVRVIKVPRATGITVMVKMWGDPARKLRLLITDDRDRSINPVREDDRIFTDECGASEVQEYPGAQVMDAERVSARGDARRGIYCDSLGSDEAIIWYRKSLAREKSAHPLFLLASALRSCDGMNRSTARFEEARRILDEINTYYPGYAPARQFRPGLLAGRGDYLEAYREGRKAVSSSPRDAYSCLAFLDILDYLGRDREFADTAGLIRKEYADSPLLLQKESAFYATRDQSARLDALKELLKKSFFPDSARTLIGIYTARGDYESALKFINSNNYNNDFTRELIDVLIRKGDFDEARTVIFKSLISSDNPDLYNSLAMIDIAQSDDPSMYLQKLLDADPSDFRADEYLKYVGSGQLVNPFNRYLEASGADALKAGPAPSASPVDVLYRQRIYVLNEDGSSRVFYEEIVRVNNETGAQRWRRVQLPRRGEFRLVSVRVHDRNGNHTDLYSVDGESLSIGPVRKDTLLHLSYIIKNAVPIAPGSGFFSMPPDFIQAFDEPVRRVSVKVIAPDRMKLQCMASRGITVEKARAGSMLQYSFALNDLGAVKQEQLTGDMRNPLPYVAFSTMEGPGDFITWYNGRISGADSGLDAGAGQFARDSVERTIEAVYEFVARRIGLEKGGIGSPRPAAETWFGKKGSAEDKVLLARMLLEQLGIRSYTAFARSKFLQDPGEVIHHEYFTDILLYVPLDAGSALWLDFSSPANRCGVTRESVAETEAYVVVNDYYHLKKIKNAALRP